MEFADGRGASIVLDRASRGPELYLDMRLDGESAIVHTAIGGRVRLAAGITRGTGDRLLTSRSSKAVGPNCRTEPAPG
jgi:hypothetical protein